MDQAFLPKGVTLQWSHRISRMHACLKPGRITSQLALGALILLGFIKGVAPVQAAEVIPGRCHMDMCSWFSIEEKDLVGTDRNGALFRVVTKFWQSQHPGGSYDRRTPRRGGGTATSCALCSKTHPALLEAGTPGRWAVNELDLGPESVLPGAAETATAVYFAVCHAVAVTNTGEELTRLARRFRYPAPSADAVSLPETVDRPEAILRR